MKKSGWGEEMEYIEAKILQSDWNVTKLTLEVHFGESELFGSGAYDEYFLNEFL